MYGAISDEVNKLYDEEKENQDISSIEDLYNELYYTKTALENLDTNMQHDELSDDDFKKLKELVVQGNSLTEAYMNILPNDILKDCKDVIKNYNDELLDAIVNSKNVRDYNANIQLLIDNLSTIYDNKEYSLEELKNMLDRENN